MPLRDTLSPQNGLFRSRSSGVFRLLVTGVNHPLDRGALFIHRAGVPALVNHPMLVVVAEKEQVLLAGFHLEAIIAMLAEDGNLARFLALYLPVYMDNIGGAIQAVP